MTRALTIALLLGFAPCLLASADDPVSRESKELEGEWRLVEVEANGEKPKGDDAKNLVMVFKGDEITVRSRDGSGRPRKKMFKLIPGKPPMGIDILSLDGQEKFQTSACIYSLEKDRLKLCMPYSPMRDPLKRPDEFRTKPGDGLMLFVLERAGAK